MLPRSPRAPRLAVPLLLAVLLGVPACAGDEARSASPAPSSSRAMSPSPSVSDTALPPAVQGMEPCPGDEDKEFELEAGGYSFSGMRRGRGDSVAIMSHQVRGTPCDLAALAARLATEGFRVISWTAEPSADVTALQTLVEVERRRGARQVVLVGASKGATASLYVAGTVRPAVDAVVALSPGDYAAAPGDLLPAVRRYRGPMMVVTAEQDVAIADIPPELARVHEGAEQVEVLPGISDHGKLLVSRRDTPVADAVSEFLGSAAG